MTNYSFIRIDRSLVVPATSIFSDDGTTVYVRVPGFETPLPCGGEIGDALRMFLEGTRVFRVSPNGVLDIFAGLVENLQARQAFTQSPQTGEIGQGFREDFAYKEPDLSDVITDAKTYKPDTVPSLNIDAIARGIRGRKD